MGPNLVFAFFFLLVFFEPRGRWFSVVSYGVIAGFFLDVFSYHYLGISVVLLLVIALLLKKSEDLLHRGNEEHPLLHFIVLFIASFIAFVVISNSISWATGQILASQIVTRSLLWELFYTFVSAFAGFPLFKYGFKKVSRKKIGS